MKMKTISEAKEVPFRAPSRLYCKKYPSYNLDSLDFTRISLHKSSGSSEERRESMTNEGKDHAEVEVLCLPVNPPSLPPSAPTHVCVLYALCCIVDAVY
jgi:hypothetical protein